MEIKEGLKKVRGLADLNIGVKDRREIITSAYLCLRKHKGFPERLEKSIEKTKEKGLSGKEAYSSIINDLSEYRLKLQAQINLYNNSSLTDFL